MMHLPLPLVIVAGGKSSRMGSDKALLPFGDFATLTQFQLSRFAKAFSALHVSCKEKEKFSFETSFIEDIPSYHESSPLVALLSILEEIKTPACVLSVDTPFVTFDIFKRLYDVLEDNIDAIIARSPFGTHPLCGIYAPSLIPNIIQMLSCNEHKMEHLLRKSAVTYVDFEEDAPFFNLNHPHEYTYAKALL